MGGRIALETIQRPRYTIAPRPLSDQKSDLVVLTALTSMPSIGRRTFWAGFALAALAAALPGCVQRRLTIRSNPPGALVYVDDYQIGTTPIATNFTYYGTRKIRLVKDGYETLTVMQTIPPPWYQIPPLDFVTENLLPGELRDHRTFEYQLVPQAVVPTEQLLSRAESLRAETQTSGVVRTEMGQAPLAPSAPTPPSLQPPPTLPNVSPTTPLGPAPAGLDGLPNPGGAVPHPLRPPGGWQNP